LSAAWGIDGYRKGWVGVAIGPEGGRRFELLPTAAALAQLRATMIMIDIPIGLPESGDRGCDRAARALLKGAQSRVFLGLRRPLLGYLDNYAAANAWAKCDGKGLGKQAFHILPKIAAVDAIMTPARQERFRECHPELVFARLNGGTPLVSKHEDEGLRARRELLARHGFDAIDCWLGQLRGTGAKPDDLFDACVLALAASEAGQGRSQRVGCPEARDRRGLRMDIWY
jgi:predicted RNase H-like nuclease